MVFSTKPNGLFELKQKILGFLRGKYLISSGVYIVQSLKDGKLYTGFTDNLRKRILKHNLGKVFSTKSKRPLKLIYLEICLHKPNKRPRVLRGKEDANPVGKQSSYGANKEKSILKLGLVRDLSNID